MHMVALLTATLLLSNPLLTCRNSHTNLAINTAGFPSYVV